MTSLARLCNSLLPVPCFKTSLAVDSASVTKPRLNFIRTLTARSKASLYFVRLSRGSLNLLKASANRNQVLIAS